MKKCGMFDCLSRAASSPKTPASNFLTDHMAAVTAKEQFDQNLQANQPADWDSYQAACRRDRNFEEYASKAGSTICFDNNR